jgi:small ligand-binding sensory domain FIST
MQISAASVVERNPKAAVEDLISKVLHDGSGPPLDLVFLFVSQHHAQHLEDLVRTVRRRLDPVHLIGCTGESVLGSTILGGAEEFDEEPALALWVAAFPGVTIRSAWVRAEESTEGVVFLGMPELPPQTHTLVVLGEPYTFPAADFVRRVAEDHPHVTVVGGMASGGQNPGEIRLIEGDRVHESGAVVVALGGKVSVHPVVSQGCRPFGKPFVVTGCQGNLLSTLGGKPALQCVAEEAKKLSEDERALLSRGLHIGCAVDSGQASAGAGEYLIRNVLGAVEESGTLAVGDGVRLGQTVQFHMRDPSAASDEISRLVRAARNGSKSLPYGGLLFTCNGRGLRMFETPSHDCSAVEKEFNGMPLAGFFANGEIGPVGSASYVHGFTAVLVLFCDLK